MNKINKTILISTILSASTLLVGCNKTEDGAAFGATIGALAGQAIGGDTGGTLIGAGVGALLGGAIGNDQQVQQNQDNNGAYTTRQSTIRTVLNEDGTYSTVGQETTNSQETVGGYQGLP